MEKVLISGIMLATLGHGGNPAKQKGSFRCEICASKDSISSLLSYAIYRNETGSLGALQQGKEGQLVQQVRSWFYLVLFIIRIERNYRLPDPPPTSPSWQMPF